MKKLFLAFAACLMAFSISAAELNIYASGLKAGALSAEKKLTIDYVLNAPATTLEFQVLNASGIAVKTIAITGDANLSKGAHTGVVIDLSECPAGEFTWALKASAAANTVVSADLAESNTDLDFYQPRDLEVDVNPESPYFGQIYLSNSWSAKPTYGDKVTVSGIHIIDPLLNYIGGYDGGITWSGTNSTLSSTNKRYGSFRVQVDERGYVYVNEGYTHELSAIYVMDPANPSANFTPVLSTTDKKYDYIRGFELVGEGDARKLAINDGSKGLYVYEIGNNTNVTAEPTLLAAGSATGVVNGFNALESDGRGGYWAYQYRSSDSQSNSVLNHINASGTRDYNSSKEGLGLAETQEATFNLNKDRTLMAVVNGTTEGIVYSITWDEDGLPTLTKEYNFYSYKSSSDNTKRKITAVAFDYADNLYVGTSADERLRALATPKADNSCVTPAAAKYSFEIEAEAGVVLAASITINEGAAATLEKGATKQLTTTVLPAETTNKTVLWSSDAEDIATVENGLITAIAPGEATITASIDAVATTFKVTVKKPVVKITEASQDLAKGSTLQLHATLTPEDASATIVWATSDETTVSVSNAGLVTAVNSGKATITAKTADSEVASIEITVPASPIAAGTYNVGGAEADYTSLAAACEDLNRNGILGDVTLAICADLTEPKNIGLVNTSDYTITIRPDGETLRTITFTQGGSSAITGSLVIGAANPVGSDVTTATQNVIIDGFAEGSEVSTLAFVHDNLGGSLRVADGSNNIIRNITSSYGENSSGTRYQIRLTGTNNDIIGCTIIGNRSSRVVVLESTEDALIEGNTFEISGLAEASLAYGIHGYSVTGTVTIRGNKFTKVESPSAADKGVAALSTQGGSWIIENNYFAGMDFTNATADTKARINYIRTIIAANKTIIRHNTFYIPSLSNKPANADNKVCAIAAEGTGASATVENNLFVSAEESAQHAFFYGNTMTISNNVFHTVAENAKAYIVGNNALAAYLESDATAKSAEPKFADAAHGDLSLVEGGEGLLVSSIADVTTDIEGTKRGAEKAYAGAFEYVDPGTGTAIENTNVEQTNVRKVIENGQMIIIRDGIRYNVMGVRMN